MAEALDLSGLMSNERFRVIVEEKVRLINDALGGLDMADQPDVMIKRGAQVLPENPKGIPTSDPAPVSKPATFGKTRKQAFHEYVESQTAFLREQVEDRINLESLEGKRAALQNAIASIGLNRTDRNTLADICGILLGTKLDLAQAKSSVSLLPYRRFACVVPLENSVGHNYRLGETFLVVLLEGSNIRCCSAAGRTGNNMARARKETRPATKEEVDAFMAQVGDVDRLMDNLNVTMVFMDAPNRDEESSQDVPF